MAKCRVPSRHNPRTSTADRAADSLGASERKRDESRHRRPVGPAPRRNRMWCRRQEGEPLGPKNGQSSTAAASFAALWPLLPSGCTLRLPCLQAPRFEPGGRVLESDFRVEPSGFGAVGHSQCGIGGRRSGRIETFFMPVSPPLRRGWQQVRVTAVGASCSREQMTASASRTFRLNVR